VALEALVRWQHPSRGLLAPDAFIPLAEETGMIRELGRQVMTGACRQLRAWLDAGVPVERVSVNLSPVQLRATGLVDEVRETLRTARVPAERFELEITETAAMLEPRRSAEALEELRAMGVRVTLDDFGTGYASLAYLRDLPFDAIKLDRSFVTRLGQGDGNTDEGIVAAVVSLGRSLGATVIAEGVETEAQLRSLERVGCDAVQGFLLSRPLPPDEVAAALAGVTVG